jgi:uncharacterized circularly permuted ATP-grasp superfamily protein
MRQFDEMYSRLPAGGEVGEVRNHYLAYARWLQTQDPQTMAARREEAEVIFRRVGITFAVYGDKDEDGSGTERLIPFDLIPRIIAAKEWKSMEAGLVQRVTALNRFIHDVYHDQEILKAGIIPREQIERNAQWLLGNTSNDAPVRVPRPLSQIKEEQFYPYQRMFKGIFTKTVPK